MNSTAPRRRPSKAVYRRRRLVLLLVFLLIVAGVVLAILRPWQSGASSAPTDSPAPVATSDATPTPDMSTLPDSSGTPPVEGAATGDVEPCTSDEVTVTAKTDKSTYAAGEDPQLSVVLANVSNVDCTIDAGTASQVYEISSGDEVYWRSTDCQADPSNQVVTLTAGQEIPSAAALVWDRTRSSSDTCDATDRPAAPADGASYHLTVTIGGIVSAETAQFILN